MPKIVAPYRQTGLATVYLVLERMADNYLLGDLAGTFSAAPASYPSMTESSTRYQDYEADIVTLNNGYYQAAAYVRSGTLQDRQNDARIWSGSGRILNDQWIDLGTPILNDGLSSAGSPLPGVVVPYTVSGLSTVYLVFESMAGNLLLSSLAGAFEASPASFPYLTESTTRPQTYEGSITALNDGIYRASAYIRQGASQDRTTDLHLWSAQGRIKSNAWVHDYFPVVDAATTVRQQIVTAIDTRLHGILTANGYRTNLGSNVYTWKTEPFTASQIPGADIQDGAEDTVFITCGEHLHRLTVNVRVVSTTEADVRKAIADVVQAVGTDVEFSGLAQDTGIDTDGSVGQDQRGETLMYAGRVTLIVEYTSDPFTP